MLAHRPRLCERAREESAYYEGAATVAAGLRVPKSLGDRLILKVIRSSGGAAVAVGDEDIGHEMELLLQSEGVPRRPRAAAAFAAVRKLARAGEIREGEEVVVLNTATGLKCPDLLDPAVAARRFVGGRDRSGDRRRQ